MNSCTQFHSDIEFCLQSKIALSLINKKRQTDYCYIKPKQIDCVKSALSSDTIVVLPTGYGKSLIYELVQTMNKTKIIIISPINAIIDEQLIKLGSSAMKIDTILINCLHQGTGNEVNRFMRGSADFFIGHPEHFLDKTVCDKFNNWDNISHIFVDEAHCVVTWGQDFRPAFEKISKLRSIFPKANLVAMTATATLIMQKEIHGKLCMRSPKLVASNPNRENVKIIVMKRKPTVGGKTPVDDTIEDLLMPYIKELCRERANFQKTIIYSNLKTCGLGYDIVQRHVLKSQDGIIMECVSQYHAPSTDEKKKQIASEMRNLDGQVRMLFATEAYGMGADAPDIRRVIHIGPPNSLETYLQEVGRAGRDGKISTAILYYNASDLGANRQNMTSEMREFCKNDKCRRQFICHHFGFEKPTTSANLLHDCCDICQSQCECHDCFSKLIMSMEVHEETKHHHEDMKQSADNINEYLSSALRSYFLTENQSTYGVIHTGLTERVLQKIVKDHLNTEDGLRTAFPHIQTSYISNILHIITHVQLKTT